MIGIVTNVKKSIQQKRYSTNEYCYRTDFYLADDSFFICKVSFFSKEFQKYPLLKEGNVVAFKGASFS